MTSSESNRGNLQGPKSPVYGELRQVFFSRLTRETLFFREKKVSAKSLDSLQDCSTSLPNLRTSQSGVLHKSSSESALDPAPPDLIPVDLMQNLNRLLRGPLGKPRSSWERRVGLYVSESECGCVNVSAGQIKLNFVSFCTVFSPVERRRGLRPQASLPPSAGSLTSSFVLQPAKTLAPGRQLRRAETFTRSIRVNAVGLEQSQCCGPPPARAARKAEPACQEQLRSHQRTEGKSSWFCGHPSLPSSSCLCSCSQQPSNSGHAGNCSEERR